MDMHIRFPNSCMALGVSFTLLMTLTGCANQKPPMVDGKPIVWGASFKKPGIEFRHIDTIIVNMSRERRGLSGPAQDISAPGQLIRSDADYPVLTTSFYAFVSFFNQPYELFPTSETDHSGQAHFHKWGGSIWKTILMEYPPIPIDNPTCLLELHYAGERVVMEWAKDEEAGKRRILELKAKAGIP